MVEAWHSRLLGMIVTPHCNLWKFLEHIKKDELDNRRLIIQLQGGHRNIKYPVRKNYARDQAAIERIVANYSTYKCNNTIHTYLLALSYRIKRPQVDGTEVEGEE